MTELNLMMGIPGSGKSTWLRNYFYNNKVNPSESNILISRDEIRFELMDKYNTNNYFEHEKEVWKTFVNNIQEAINHPYNNSNIVWVDSTLITKKARKKLLDSLDLTYVDNINIKFVNTALDEALRRNNNRNGRKRVPDNVIEDMFNRLEKPKKNEKYLYNNIEYIT